MAYIENGILGAVVGRIGPVSCFVRQGKNIIRTARSNGVDLRTHAQLAQRQKIAVCNRFTKAFAGTGFFNISFPAYGQKGTGYNRATSTLLNLALCGSYPDQYLDWKKVMISKGPLPSVEHLIVNYNGDGMLIFEWASNEEIGTGKKDDEAILVAYSLKDGRAIFSLEKSIREDCQAKLNINSFTGGEIAAWLTFRNKKGDVADSKFGGIISI